MKSLVAVSALIVLGMTVSQGSAADLSDRVYTKAPAAQPVYNWTGFYVGGNVGWGGGRFGDNVVFTDPTYTLPLVAQLASTAVKTNGVIGGGQLGYNWQNGAWVFGLETDFQGASQRAALNCSQDVVNGPLGTSDGPLNCSARQRLDWFGTVRGRIGWLPEERFLVYATGGLAYGHTSTQFNLEIPTYVSPVSFHNSELRAGWTIGAGAEWAVTGNWSVKAEYLYMDMGSSSHQYDFFNVFVGQSALSAALSSKLTENIVRVGFNYRFGN